MPTHHLTQSDPHRLPYEAGSPVREYVENETGDNAHTQPLPSAVAVTIADPVQTKALPPRSFTTEQIPVGVLAQRIASDLNQRVTVTIQPTGADIFVGNAGVTLGTGFLVPAGASLTLDTTAPVYAISAGAATVYVLSQHRDG